MTTLVNLGLRRAEQQPNSIAYTQLSPSGDIFRQITYAQLDRAARGLAAHLQSVSAPGSRILLAYPTGLDFITSFFACLYAGLIAVPVYPPFARSQWPRFAAIAKDCDAALICTLDKHKNFLTKNCLQTPLLANTPCLATDTISPIGDEAWRFPAINGKTLAFLQYTSGTTGNPKGVMVNHDNIMTNQAMISQAFNHDQQDKVLGWLPMYHDMGLIGVVLNPFYVGCESIVMEPLSFLRQPFRWLKAISDFKATTSGAPNFAYDLCVHKISTEEKQQLDLSHWKNAFNGSEKVHYQTLEKFSRYFADCGFQYKAFLPCYGLAEATLFVAGKQSQSKVETLVVDKNAFALHQIQTGSTDETNQYTLTGCGDVSLSEVRIVNPDTSEICESHQIGEIWITGNHVTRGYWNKDALNSATFRTVAGCKRTYLRTGDLGIIVDGQLYITGRLKELIIVRGKNFYPQDIELVAQNSNSACRLGRGAAFSVETNGEEQVVLVQEIKKTHARMFDSEVVQCDIQLALRAQLNLEISDIVFVKQASIPVTSSGKTQRQLVKQNYLHQTLPGVIPSSLAA